MIINSPFFSIIIPTYNSDQLLARALQSIQAQVFKDYSVIIQDGLSSDTTLSIVDDFKNQGMEITANSQKDQGIYDAMNKALEQIGNSYILFLGSDDFLFDDMVLQNVADAISKHRTDVIYGNVYSTRFNGVYDGVFTIRKLMKKNLCHQSIFVHKDVFKKIGEFSLRYKIHSDYHHNIRWFCNRSISKQYINLTIANYADGGFSSLNDDLLFINEKIAVFKQHFDYYDLMIYYFHRIKNIISKYFLSNVKSND